MWVKICGITRIDDALAALDAGADAIGLNFVSGPRRIEVDVAERIIAAVGRPERIVALVRYEAVNGVRAETQLHEESLFLAQINRLIDLGVGSVQIYADAPQAMWAALRRRDMFTLLPFPVEGPQFAAALRSKLMEVGAVNVSAVLLDSAAGGRLGGSGRICDWEAIAEVRRMGALDGLPPVMLAGGLTPDNVAAAVRTVRPSGVDVSSGVEQAPGIKDHERVRSFIQAARQAASSLP